MRFAPLLLSLLSLPVAAGCSNTVTEDAETSEHGIEVFAEDLWAGLPSATVERYSADPCANTRRLDNDPISYDSWVRQRAGVRNICFEVWKPGVTDTDNWDYWKLLDVQVHYKFKGTSDWKTAYVPSIDRRGNNRRYAWSLDWQLDPLGGSNVGDAKAPFEIVQEGGAGVLARSELEVYFTVNGHELTTSTNDNFKVAYTATLYGTQTWAPPANGAVLHPDVSCNGLTIGGGAGYFAADVKDAAAIDALSGGNRIHAPSLGLASGLLSLTFGSRDASGRLYDGLPDRWRAEVSPIENGKVTVRTKAYDRGTKKLETLSWQFDGCSAQ